MHRTVPGFRTLHFGDVVDVHLLDVERDNNAVIAERLAELLVDQFQLIDRARLRFALEISVEAADALIKLAFRREPNGGDEAVLTEAATSSTVPGVNTSAATACWLPPQLIQRRALRGVVI